MQKGGRMTYGFGHWRSGYKVLIPWHWRWVTYNEDPFDYLRGRGLSGSGNRIDEEGNILPAIYWECFREGYDDYRYVYTLQQCIVERENSSDQECKKVVADAKKFLEALWLDIEVQPKYLKTEFWDDKQFDAYRFQAARFIETLLKYPKTNDAIAPTVVFDPSALSSAVAAEDLFSSSDVEVFSLSENRYARWSKSGEEASFTVADSTDLTPQRPILRSVFAMDHEGGSPWPGLLVNVPNNAVILKDYDYLYLKIKIDSNRSETEDDNTFMRIFTSNYGSSVNHDTNVNRDFGDIQRTWIPVAIPISEILANANSRSDSSAFFRTLKIYFFESDYKHGTRMEVDFADVSLLRSKVSSVDRIVASNLVHQGEKWFDATIEVSGRRSADNTLTIKLVTNDGTAISEMQQVMSGERNYRVNLDMSDVKAGIYLLRVSINDKDGKMLSEQERRVEVVKWED
jgi:ribosomal protein S18